MTQPYIKHKMELIIKYIIWIITLDILQNGLVLIKAENERCSYVAETESLLINQDIYNIDEVHIRHNIKGSVVIKDGDVGENRIKIEVEKKSGTKAELDNFIVQQDDVILGYETYVILQLDYVDQKSSVLVIAGSSVGTGLFLAVIVVLICCYHKRHKEIVRGPDDSSYHSPRRAPTGTLDESEHDAATSTTGSKSSVEPQPKTLSSLRLRTQPSDVDSDDFPPPPESLDDSFRQYATLQCTTSSGSSTPKKLLSMDERTMHTLPKEYGDYREKYDVRTSSHANRQIKPYRESSSESSHSFVRAIHIQPPSRSETLRAMQPQPTAEVDSVRAMQAGSLEASGTPGPMQTHATGGSGPSYSGAVPVTPRHSRRPQAVAEEAGTGGGGMPRGLQRSTLMCIMLMSLVAVVYAGCIAEPTADVIIYMPLSMRLAFMRVFFNEKYDNIIEIKHWTFRNMTQLGIYDVKNVGVTNELPCQNKCSNMKNQHLVACDVISGKCVCQRGYAMKDNTCIDVDECVVTTCPLETTCQNTMGSYICHCGLGFYHQHGKCQACSQGCPEGEYELMHCTYEADRICTDAAHPVLWSENETEAGYIEGKIRRGVKVEASKNVFLDNLHNAKNLATPYYVTSNKQETGFNWYRETGSKIRVNIGLTELNIIPEFTDVSYQSDNSFITESPNIPEQSGKFEKIIEKYCRHPIPDYYHITLEVARDRSTAAREFTCDRNTCPEGYKFGDKYINRTIDTECAKLRRKGTYPEAMGPHSNSMVCVEETDLLRIVFNRTASPVIPITIPSKECKTSHGRCEECLARYNCLMQDIFEEACCARDCLQTSECKASFKSECTNAPVECAMGDAYRYTIEPVFQNMQSSFKCHLKYKKPEVFYKLWFYVTVINTTFETPKIYHTVYTDEIENVSEGELNKYFFTIHHDSSVRLDTSDVILSGQEEEPVSRGHADSAPTWNFQLYDKKREEDYSGGAFQPRKMSNNVDHIFVQFSEPFAYSSMNWGIANTCQKNISKIKPVQPHFKGEGQQVSPIIDSVDSPYHYAMLSAVSSPKVTVYIPSNISVLDWWFRDKKVELLLDDSLFCNLDLNKNGKAWIISIQGNMTDCPGYTKVTINDRMELEEVLQYDVLVTCPSTFNVTFFIPTRDLIMDKTFDIVFNDTKKVHRVFLTYLVNKDNDVWYKNRGILTHIGEQIEEQKEQLSPVVMLMVFMAVFMTITGVIHITFECMRKSKPSKEKDVFHYSLADGHIQLTGSDVHSSCAGTRGMGCVRFAFLVAYITFKVIYMFCFTFTILYSIVLLLCKEDSVIVSNFNIIQSNIANKTMSHSKDIEKFAQNELKRQTKLVQSADTACSEYSQTLLWTIWSDINSITLDINVQNIYSGNASLSYHLNQRHLYYTERYKQQIRAYSDRRTKQFYDDVIMPAAMLHQKFLENISKSRWFMFAQRLYNESKDKNMLKETVVRSEFNPDLIAYAKFLGMMYFEDVEFQTVNFWERYNGTAPKLKELPLLTTQPLFCENKMSEWAADITYDAKKSMNKLNTSRYFVQDSANNIKVPIDTKLNSRDYFSYLQVFHDQILEDISNSSCQFPEASCASDLEINMDWAMYKYIFLVLDILLVIYRFSHLYIDVKSLCFGFEEREELESSCMREGRYDRVSYNTISSDQFLPLQTDLNSSLCTNESRDSKAESKAESVQSHYSFKHRQPNGNLVSLKDSFSVEKKLAFRRLHYNNSCLSRLKHTFKVYASKFVLSGAVPKILILTVIMFCVYWILIACNTIPELFSLAPGVISQLLTSLRTHVDFTNTYVTAQAHTADQSVRFLHERLSKPLLREMVGIVQFFNAEQVRLVERFVNQSCSIHSSYNPNTSCDIVEAPSFVQIPILPCNTIPLSASNYRLTEAILEEDIRKLLTPLLTASHDVITSFLYCLCTVGVAMVVLYMTDAVVLQCLRTQRLFPVRITYTVPSNTVLYDVIAAQRTSNTYKGYDADVDHGGFEGCSTIQRSTLSVKKQVQFSPIKSMLTVPRTDTVMSDLGYSETKV